MVIETRVDEGLRCVNRDIGVLRVDESHGVSELLVGMWTREAGESDLSLEIAFPSDATGNAVRDEFVNLHVM